MNKTLFENPAFTRRENVPGQGVTVATFNNVAETNPFDEIFETKPLDKSEANKLSVILKEGFVNDGSMTGDKVGEDYKTLNQITAAIRAIDKQCTYLKAERAAQAREILKPYRDGTFTQWLELAFGSRFTGHNLLAYYDLHSKLCLNDRECLKKMPVRVAYRIASRDGDIDKKAEIIREHYSSKSDEILAVMEAFLPVDPEDKRKKKSPIEKLLQSLEASLNGLITKKNDLTEEDRLHLQRLENLFNSLLNV